MKNKATIAVLGEGAWGTALATILVRNGHAVKLWCYHSEIADEINAHHTNTRYLPGFELSAKIQATPDAAQALHNVDWICEAIPVQYLRSVITQMRPHVAQNTPWIMTSKGIEKDTLLFPTEIVADVLGYSVPHGVLVGPSFARDVMRQEQTGLLVASAQSVVQSDISALFANKYLVCMDSTDTHGAQLCAAFKNVVAVLVGISDGHGHGDNARALLVTRCFQKLVALAHATGGSLETVHGLAGIGDLFLTASSTQSRNYSVGKALGAGESLQSIIDRTGFTPEGINTMRSIRAYAHMYHVSLDDLNCDI